MIKDSNLQSVLACRNVSAEKLCHCGKESEFVEQILKNPHLQKNYAKLPWPCLADCVSWDYMVLLNKKAFYILMMILVPKPPVHTQSCMVTPFILESTHLGQLAENALKCTNLKKISCGKNGQFLFIICVLFLYFIPTMVRFVMYLNAPLSLYRGTMQFTTHQWT